jgi:hypothetical protein
MLSQGRPKELDVIYMLTFDFAWGSTVDFKVLLFVYMYLEIFLYHLHAADYGNDEQLPSAKHD